MPTGPKGEKRPADVIGNAVKVMRIAASDSADDLREPVMQSRQQSPSVPSPLPSTVTPAIGKPRIVMNGDHLDIHASVDLAGLQQLQTMLQKYEEILKMMEPKKDGTAN